MNEKKRGAFILLEGIDHSGKTTQAELLTNELKGRGIQVQSMRFPDRETSTGKIIDSYLRQHSDLEDHAIHLLYTANRWEKSVALCELLSSGTTLIVDRYATSGVAYSCAKKGIDLEWCMAPERGLPAPDAVIYLDISVETALERGQNKEQERYEQASFLRKVKEVYETKLKQANWNVVDASRSRGLVLADLLSISQQTIASIQPNTPIRTLW